MNSLKGFGSAAGNMEAVKALVEAGADVSLAADGGVTPLHAAAELGGLDLVNLLLKVLPFGLLPFVCLALCGICLCTHSICLPWAVRLPFQVIALSLPVESGSAFPGQLFACLSPQLLPLQMILCKVAMWHLLYGHGPLHLPHASGNRPCEPCACDHFIVC